MKADLHLHTTASDGLLSPAEMVSIAAQMEIEVMAVTDHDNLDGLEEASYAAKRYGVDLIPGVELSVGGEEEIHLLGYGIDPGDAILKKYLDDLRQERAARTGIMLDKLSRAGYKLEERDALNPDGCFTGRAAIARSLVRKGYFKTTKEVFDTLLGAGKPCYAERRKIGVSVGCRFLRDRGAVTVLAHPGRMREDWDQIQKSVSRWLTEGLDGLEAWHSSHTEQSAIQYDHWAREQGMLVTGGSDSHGERDKVDLLQGLDGWKSCEADVSSLKKRIQERKRERKE